MEDTLLITAEAATDVGRKRDNNEDHYGEFEVANGKLFIVCDGVGGHNAGEVASRMAVEQIYSYFKNNGFLLPLELLSNAFYFANEKIVKQAESNPHLQGMATTCVCLFIINGLAYYGSVGDSRIYQLKEGIFTAITKDQSFVQQMIDRGVISASQARSHPRKNEVTNILGVETLTPPLLGKYSYIASRRRTVFTLHRWPY